MYKRRMITHIDSNKVGNIKVYIDHTIKLKWLLAKNNLLLMKIDSFNIIWELVYLTIRPKILINIAKVHVNP